MHDDDYSDDVCTYDDGDNGDRKNRDCEGNGIYGMGRGMGMEMGMMVLQVIAVMVATKKATHVLLEALAH